MKRTYDFATIGFRPFTETEEFVTVGVVALDTVARHFDFFLHPVKGASRVGGLFPDLDKEVFREAHDRLKAELEGIRAAVNAPLGADVPVFPHFRDPARGLFSAITSPREGVFCFPVKGRRMANDMVTVLEALKTRFIDRKGLTHQQPAEQQMVKELRRVLGEAKLLKSYKRDVRIGTEEFHVNFALAHMKDAQRADKAIRPLNFDLTTPTEIYNHGDALLQKLKRLKQFGYRPDHCLLTVRAPKEVSGLRADAFQEIQKEFIVQECEWVNEMETDKVIAFARIPEDPILKLA